MIIEALQDEGRAGPVRSWFIAKWYPIYCYSYGLKPIQVALVLAAVHELLGPEARGRYTMPKESKELGRVTCYVIPEKSTAKVVPISRRQAS